MRKNSRERRKGERGKEENEEVGEKRRVGSGACFYGLRGAREVASWGPFLRPVFLFSQAKQRDPAVDLNTYFTDRSTLVDFETFISFCFLCSVASAERGLVYGPPRTRHYWLGHRYEIEHGIAAECAVMEYDLHDSSLPSHVQSASASLGSVWGTRSDRLDPYKTL